MYGSSPVSKDLNLPYPTAAAAAASFKDSDHHQRQQQMSSGLLRYRSAPSSLFGETIEDLLPVRPSSPETDAIFARFLAATPDLIRDKPPPQFPPPPASAAMEQKAAAEHAGGFAPPQMLYHQQNHHQQHHHQQLQSHVDGPYRSVEMEADQMKSGGDGGGIGGGGSNLIRHSSSPAGLFAHLNVENNGYGMVRGMGGGFRGGDTGIPPASRLKNQISFSSRQSSLMSQISEMGSEGMGGSSPEDSSRQNYNPGYQVGSWDDAPLMSEGFSGVKRARDDGGKLGLNQTEPQNGELRSKSGLNSTDVAAIEKFLQFQDSVPCKIRAKRGCATHPRSIAERVRRTRISERMRKLQELVPNMDKQTNTADMLDLAVEYIKDLQKQVKTVSDSRANCTCSSGKQKPYSNPQA